MYGNGCAGSTASGVSTGKMRSSNTSRSSSRWLGFSSSQSTMRTPAAREQRPTLLVEDRVLPARPAPGAGPDRVELLARAQPVRRGRVARPAADLLPQPGDADLEELVEVAAEDREELDALEQRLRASSAASASTRSSKSSRESSRFRNTGWSSSGASMSGWASILAIGRLT